MFDPFETATGEADIDADDLLYQISECPLGKDWSEWTTEWWKWLLSIPKFENPAAQRAGNCKLFYEYTPDVLFLVGTDGGNAEHSIALPSGKSLLLPIINFVTSFLEEPFLKTDSDLVRRAQSDIDDIVYKEAWLNGKIIPNISNYRVSSLPFDFTFPENNLFGLPPGRTRCSSDGYWLFIKPLPPGENTLSVGGACSSGKTKVHVKYNILVEK